MTLVSTYGVAFADQRLPFEKRSTKNRGTIDYALGGGRVEPRRREILRRHALIGAGLFLMILQQASAQCPNMCSGHGDCGADNVCGCEDGYDFAADCSMRTCPYGVAWADKAYAKDQAHSKAECSNAGVCSRSVGMCTCFDGYTGQACQRCACSPPRARLFLFAPCRAAARECPHRLV